MVCISGIMGFGVLVEMGVSKHFTEPVQPYFSWRTPSALAGELTFSTEVDSRWLSKYVYEDMCINVH